MAEAERRRALNESQLEDVTTIEEATRRFFDEITPRNPKSEAGDGGDLSASVPHYKEIAAHFRLGTAFNAFSGPVVASPEAIFSRVGHQTHRPLLRASDPLSKIKELLHEREPFYRQADVLLNCEQRSPREVAQHVMHQLRVARDGNENAQ